jgi:hypothetical protein
VVFVVCGSTRRAIRPHSGVFHDRVGDVLGDLMIDVGAEVLDDPLHKAIEPPYGGTASLDQGRPFGAVRSGPHCDDRGAD